MTAYNKNWHTTKPLSDFDAVSLYPSAMAECYTVEGLPEVIPEDKLNMEFLSRQGAYIVEIRINKVNKHYAFPIIVRKVVYTKTIYQEGNRDEYFSYSLRS